MVTIMMQCTHFHRLGELDALKEIRNRLCDLLSVPKFKIVAVSNTIISSSDMRISILQAAAPADTRPRDELGSYKGMRNILRNVI